MSTQMMKAVQQHAFGGPEVLSYDDAPLPVLQAGEVLVQVHAVGVNPPDSYLRDGYQQLPPEWRPEVRFPLILGTDLSGMVVARADDVREVAVGDEVYAMARFPEGAAGGSRAYAEYVSVPVSDLARKPLTLSHQQAAAVPMSLLTAWQFMIDPGHEVANPLQPGPHRPSPRAAMKPFYVSSAPMPLSTIRPLRLRRRCVTWIWSSMPRAARPAVVFCVPCGAAARCTRFFRSALPGRKRRDSAE
ncbi:bifunctional zinc-containing alcohol dehydrogenase/quinone oxidoreductase [Klebsiella variicola]|nr:bifunctional zinc-containing alcohol dehydrogenase/quinone oxidoreductase [Klebsiella variicola]